jgi:hypothetical protein
VTELLTNLDPERAFERGSATKDTEEWVARAAMLRALGDRGAAPARTALCDVKSGYPRIRFALEVLGPLAEVKDRDRIVALLTHEDARVRLQAASYLAEFYSCADIAPQLASILETQDDPVMTISLLGAIEGPTVDAVLRHVHRRWEGTAEWTRVTFGNSLAETVRRIEAHRREAPHASEKSGPL